MKSLFHLAFHERDLDASRVFYGRLLGCTEGRSTDTWVDFDFFGHQISLHLGEPFAVTTTGRLGDHRVPMPHLGVVLEMPAWQALPDRLVGAGHLFNQATMFFLDPCGDPIEVKGFANIDAIYDR